MRVEGVIRMARLRRESGHRSAQAVPRPPDDRSDVHAMVQWRGPAFLGHNPSTRRKLRDLIQKSKSRRRGARLVAQRDEPACNRAGLAVLVPFSRVLSVCSRTRITGCGLDS